MAKSRENVNSSKNFGPHFFTTSSFSLFNAMIKLMPPSVWPCPRICSNSFMKTAKFYSSSKLIRFELILDRWRVVALVKEGIFQFLLWHFLKPEGRSLAMRGNYSLVNQMSSISTTNWSQQQQRLLVTVCSEIVSDLPIHLDSTIDP